MSLPYASRPVLVFLGFGQRSVVRRFEDGNLYRAAPRNNQRPNGEDPAAILERNPFTARPPRQTDTNEFTRIGTVNTIIRFLGTGRVGVDTEVRGEWEPIYTDQGGRVPEDYLFSGQHAFTHLELTRWNETTLFLAQARPYSFYSPAGRNHSSDIGRMMIRQGMALTLYLVYASNSLVYSSEFQPNGWRFPFNTWLEGPDVRKLGSRANSVSLLFHSIPAYNFSDGTYRLYDADISDVLRAGQGRLGRGR